VKNELTISGTARGQEEVQIPSPQPTIKDTQQGILYFFVYVEFWGFEPPLAEGEHN
jgi:hypothetical protein